MINESLSINELLKNPRTMVRVLSESVSLQEFTGDLGRIMVRIINETLEISTNSIKQLYLLVHVVNESLHISETSHKITGLLRFINESLSLSESPIPLKTIIRAINESLSLSETHLKYGLFGAVKVIGRVIRTLGGSNKVSSANKTNITRSGGKSGTVKTYKTDKTIRSD